MKEAEASHAHLQAQSPLHVTRSPFSTKGAVCCHAARHPLSSLCLAHCLVCDLIFAFPGACASLNNMYTHVSAIHKLGGCSSVQMEDNI